MTTLFQTLHVPRKIIWISAFLVMIANSAAKVETMISKLVGITVGDTVTVLVNGHDQIHMRIMGIDAPEKKQAFGQRSKQAMSDCAFGKQTQVEWSKKNRYGRTVGKVSVDDVDCGLRQIELGLAWHYKAYKREQQPEIESPMRRQRRLPSQQKEGFGVSAIPSRLGTFATASDRRQQCFVVGAQ